MFEKFTNAYQKRMSATGFNLMKRLNQIKIEFSLLLIFLLQQFGINM